MKKRFNSRTLFFHRDALISACFTFVLYFLINLIAINVHYLDPITNALEDFEFSDLYFSKISSDQPALSEEIVLFNIGESSREQIARQIQALKAYSPKVIGVDVTFQEKKDSIVDIQLKNSLSGNIPVVLASQLNYQDNGASNPQVIRNHPFFNALHKEGYVNFYSKKNGTVRKWKPLLISKDGEILEESFSVKIIKAYSSSFTFPKRWKKQNHTELINYPKVSFITIDSSDLHSKNPSLSTLKDKIVLMGYMGDGRNAKILTDLHYTPLKRSFEGIPVPDKYGVEIHAFILNMLVNDRSISQSSNGQNELYIREVNPGLIWFIAFLIALLNMYIFLYFFVKKHILFHIVAKLIQVVSSIAVFVISVYLLEFRWKLEPSLIIIGIVLAADSLYFVEFFMKKLFRSNTYFHNPHH